MRKLFMSMALVLASFSALADILPIADISDEAAERIHANWDATGAEFQAKLNQLAMTDPRRGPLFAVYLDNAFANSGYSLDKTFLLWYKKINNGAEIAQYPALHQFASEFGFVDLMEKLVVIKQPEYRKMMIESQVFSQATIDETAKHAASLQSADSPTPVEEEEPYYGNAKADSYESGAE